MPYALFARTVQVSQAFPTKSEVWKHAAEKALVIEVTSSEEDPPRRLLKSGYTIDIATPEAAMPGLSPHGLAMPVAPLNQPLAAAAS